MEWLNKDTQRLNGWSNARIVGAFYLHVTLFIYTRWILLNKCAGHVFMRDFN